MRQVNEIRITLNRLVCDVLPAVVLMAHWHCGHISSLMQKGFRIRLLGASMGEFMIGDLLKATDAPLKASRTAFSDLREAIGACFGWASPHATEGDGMVGLGRLISRCMARCP